jgi:hypothetical protein
MDTSHVSVGDRATSVGETDVYPFAGIVKQP